MNIVTFIFIVSVTLSFLPIFASSVQDWPSQWIKVRNESRRYKVYSFCKKDFKAKRDLCENSTVDEALVPFDDQDFLPENCYCDENCNKFGDCCIDKAAALTSTQRKEAKWSCVEAPISKVGLYAYQKCHEAWAKSDVEKLCLSSPKSFLQWLPAYSRQSQTLYRNIFCAVCNNDHHDLHDWNITIICDQELSKETVLPYIREDNFNYTNGLWMFYLNGTKHRCKALLPELEVYDMRNNFGTRFCRPSVDSCSQDWTDVAIQEKCEAYTFTIGSPSLGILYKNIYCARCNGLSENDLKRLDCDLNDIAIRPHTINTQINAITSLRLLFDLDSYSSCRLEDNQVFNPITSKCMIVQCEDYYHLNQKTLRCESWEVSNDGVSLKSDCMKVFVNESDYTVNEADSSVILGDSGQRLARDQFEPYIRYDHEKAIRMNGILTCYDENHLYAAPFIYNYVQGLSSFVAQAISILGLVGYLAVFSFVPKLRNLRTMMVMSLSLALLLASIAFICGVLYRPHLETNIISNERGSLFCVMTAVGIHYFYLAAFAWMNVMAYDAWKSFKRTHERLSNSLIHFLKYSLYSWLMPAMVVMIACAFDLSDMRSEYQPLYGHRVCWISQKKALLAFFVLPVSIIILINVFFFSWTSWVLVRTNRQIKLALSAKHVKENSQRFILYARLATIMGLTWVFGIIAALTPLNFLWYPFIILNGLQGAFIFFYFTCKKDVYRALGDRIAFLIHGHEPVSASYTSKATRSSSLLPNSSTAMLQ